MSKLITNTIRHTGGSADNITLDNSQNVTVEGNATVDGNLTATGTTTISGYHPTTSRSNRNLMINGAMQVSQRGTSFHAEAYTLDRWEIVYGGTDEVPTITQHALTSSDTGPWAKGFRNSLHVHNGNNTGGADATDYMMMRYTVEAQDLANSGWDYTSASSYITLSYWVKSSVAQNFYNYLRTRDGTEKLYCWETGSLSANTWTKITKTIPGNSNITIDDDNGEGLYITIPMYWGANWTNNNSLNTWATYDSANRTPDNTSTWWTTNNATYELTGIQLEVGDTATDFEHLSYHDDLLRCQRYYYEIARGDDKVIGLTMFYNDTGLRTAIRYPVQMRTTPSVKTSNTSGHFNCYSGDGSGSGSGTTTSAFATFDTSPPYVDNNGIILASTVSDNNQSGQAGYISTNHADAYICLDSEL